MDMTSYIGNVALSTIVVMLALLAEHYATLRFPWKLSEPWNYAAGIITILAGCGMYTAQQAQVGPIDPWYDLIAFGIIAVGGGFPVVLAYAAEGRLYLKKERDAKLRHGKAQIAGVLHDPLDDLRRN